MSNTRNINDLLTPSVIVDYDRLEGNIERMQDICSKHHVALWPHIKTHKMVRIARMQLKAGATGLTCAKLSEAEAMLPSGVKSIFIANSLVEPKLAPRIKQLALKLRQLLLAATSIPQVEALHQILKRTGLVLPVMMAYDSGLGREGVRSVKEAKDLAHRIGELSHMRLYGVYTHEGHFYGMANKQQDEAIADLHRKLLHLRKTLFDRLLLWPGCSITASRMALLPGVDAVRPGAYVFGDISQARTQSVMKWENVALTVLATVVDLPEKGLALIDAGSKVFSSDKSRDGIHGIALDGRDLQVVKCNEEHGYVKGKDVKNLRVGDRIRFVPAHVCTVVNLTDSATFVRGNRVVKSYPVDARGCVQ